MVNKIVFFFVFCVQPVIEVVVDPYIALCLRPHQKEGVTFLYECVMGMHSEDDEDVDSNTLKEPFGAILA